jgi:DegT/DnrJ/EryC1/StrS aminotransferase family
MINQESFNESAFTFYRLGRHALQAAFLAINLKPKDKVLVPSFICKDLLAAIYFFEAKPIFYDVDINLRPLNLNLMGASRAVIAVNYFGFPQDLRKFYQYADNFNAVLIEDNAHGFLSQDANGSTLGFRGDFGVFSFRKTFQLPGGAGLIVNKSHKCIDLLPKQISFQNVGLSASYRVKIIFTRVQIKTGINFLFWLRRVIRIFRKLLTGYKIPPLKREDQYILPSNSSPHVRLKDILFSQDFAFEVQRRRSLFERSKLELENLDIAPVFDGLSLNICPYGYPFFANDAEAEKAIKIADSMGLDCVRWPDLPDEIISTCPDFYKRLWMINFTC